VTLGTTAGPRVGDAGTEDLLALARRVSERSRRGEDLEVYVARAVETDVRAYDGEVESLSSAASAGVGIRVVRDGRQGFAYAASLDEDVLSQTLSEARDNVVFATPDEHVGLATGDDVVPAALELWDEQTVELPTAEKVELALELERLTRHGDPRVRQVDAADYGDVAGESAVATSTGLAAATRRTVCSLSVSAIAGDGDDSHSAVGFSTGRAPRELDVEGAARDAVRRATRLMGATKGRSGRCVVVLDPRVTSTVLSVISSALSGEAMTKGRSFFAGRLGEVVASSEVSLVDDPTDARASGASTYDAEGLACRRNVLVERGTLRQFVFDTTSARRAGTVSNASAVRGGYATTPVAGCRAVALSPGGLDQEQIFAAIGTGLYVQSVTGVHSGVNPVSGDFSVGAEGLVIRDGVLAEPVRELTVASTLQRMLQSIVHIGADVEWLPGRAAGQTIAVDGMALSGV
jgi:PmbA protein